MFSTGQMIFAAFFVIVFTVVMIYAYRKDLQLHKRYYKGSLRVLVVFILFIVTIVVIKKFIVS
jgi:cytochrome bd-type quinol oxidase subunit 1